MKRLAVLGVLFMSLTGMATIPEVTAKAWLVTDSAGNIIAGKNTDEIRSIASITKLVTTMVVLDAHQPIDEILFTKHYPFLTTRRTLMEMALVKSDNTAATMLCNYYPTGYSGCIDALNNKARELQMYNTSFSDSSGLNKLNVSTASDLSKLVLAASNYPFVVDASDKNSIKIQNGRKQLTLHNTNPLAGTGHGVIVSKTGFINLSGGCIVMLMNTGRGIRAVVVLGSKNTRTRIPEAAFLATVNEET